MVYDRLSLYIFMHVNGTKLSHVHRSPPRYSINNSPYSSDNKHIHDQQLGTEQNRTKTPLREATENEKQIRIRKTYKIYRFFVV